jgi:hypothetical protein
MMYGLLMCDVLGVDICNICHYMIVKYDVCETCSRNKSLIVNH